METDDEKILKFFGFKLDEYNTWTDPSGTMPDDKPIINLEFLFEQVEKTPKVKTIVLCTHFSYPDGLPQRDGFEVSIMWDRMDNACLDVDKDPAVAFKQALIKVIDKE